MIFRIYGVLADTERVPAASGRPSHSADLLPQSRPRETETLTPSLACDPGSPELSKSYSDMAGELFTFYTGC